MQYQNKYMEDQLIKNTSSPPVLGDSFLFKEKICIDSLIKSFRIYNNITDTDIKQVNYCGYIGILQGKHHFKFGQSNGQVLKRENCHLEEFEQFNFLWIMQATQQTEQYFKRWLRSNKLLTDIIINDKRKTELFFTTEEFPIQSIQQEFINIVLRSNQHNQYKENDLLEQIQHMKLNEIQYQAERKIYNSDLEHKETKYRSDLEIKDLKYQLILKDRDIEIKELKSRIKELVKNP